MARIWFAFSSIFGFKTFRYPLGNSSFLGVKKLGDDNYQLGSAKTVDLKEFENIAQNYSKVEIFASTFGAPWIRNTRAAGEYTFSFLVQNETKLEWSSFNTSGGYNQMFLNMNYQLLIEGGNMDWRNRMGEGNMKVASSLPEKVNNFELTRNLGFLADVNSTNDNLRVLGLYKDVTSQDLTVKAFSFSNNGIKVNCRRPVKQERQNSDIDVTTFLEMPVISDFDYKFVVTFKGFGFAVKPHHVAAWIFLMILLGLGCMCAYRKWKGFNRALKLENADSMNLSVDSGFEYNY